MAARRSFAASAGGFLAQSPHNCHVPPEHFSDGRQVGVRLLRLSQAVHSLANKLGGGGVGAAASNAAREIVMSKAALTANTAATSFFTPSLFLRMVSNLRMRPASALSAAAANVQPQ